MIKSSQVLAKIRSIRVSLFRFMFEEKERSGLIYAAHSGNPIKFRKSEVDAQNQPNRTKRHVAAERAQRTPPIPPSPSLFPTVPAPTYSFTHYSVYPRRIPYPRPRTSLPAFERRRILGDAHGAAHPPLRPTAYDAPRLLLVPARIPRDYLLAHCTAFPFRVARRLKKKISQKALSVSLRL